MFDLSAIISNAINDGLTLTFKPVDNAVQVTVNADDIPAKHAVVMRLDDPENIVNAVMAAHTAYRHDNPCSDCETPCHICKALFPCTY